MAGLKDKVQSVLSEVRSLTLGAQVLLGFEYQALFLPRFDALPPPAKGVEAASVALMLVTLLCLVAPSPFHQIAEGGEATARQHAYTKALLTAALVPFVLAIGADVAIALALPFGAGWAWALGALTAAMAAWFWFGIPLMQREEQGGSPADEDEGRDSLPLKKKISELLTESRIALPGAQALLGFQLAAYLTESFQRLSAAAKLVHTASLLLIALSMILLMTPAPYHRLVENGDATERFHAFGVRVVLAALVPLALGLAGDFYVVLEKVSGSPALAAAGALLTVGFALTLWFGVPWLARVRAET